MSSCLRLPISNSDLEIEFEYADKEKVFVSILFQGNREKSYSINTKIFKYLDYYEQYLTEKGVILS